MRYADYLPLSSLTEHDEFYDAAVKLRKESTKLRGDWLDILKLENLNNAERKHFKTMERDEMKRYRLLDMIIKSNGMSQFKVVDFS